MTLFNLIRKRCHSMKYAAPENLDSLGGNLTWCTETHEFCKECFCPALREWADADPGKGNGGPHDAGD